ncbi:MAG: site-specific DNA-methyltransferase [Solirubrobacterales bacterium]
MPELEGRLELTWTNKDKRLLAHEDGSYVWVVPSDYRVAEVRLLDNAGAVGKVNSKGKRAADNLLIRGDSLNALTSLTELPEFASEYVGRVKLAYLDPPFNTQQSFLHYDDALEHSVWLTMMRDRLVEIRKLLSERGSVWLHLDDAELAYARVMLDEVFGRPNFVGCVVWEKTYTPKSNGRGLSTDHDYIVVYAKDAESWLKDGWNLLPRSDEQTGRFSNSDEDQNGPWRTYPLDVRTEDDAKRAGYRYEVVTPSGRKVKPAQGRHWALPKERFERERAEGAIWFGKGGGAMPTRKVYLKDARPGVIARTWWPHAEVGGSQEAKREIKVLFPNIEPFATPKPEAFMERIMRIGSNKGDIVLDCFLGSGTTAAVAHKMGRRWVGIERSCETLDTYAIPRLTEVVKGTDAGGITEAVGWDGGGGFRLLDVAPSMFLADEGSVFIAAWASNGKLAEVTAAQLGFDFEADPPYTGRRGRSRLAVIDGLVNADVATMLVQALPEGELLTLCGTAVDPDARSVLRNLRRGSTVRKIPASILAEYRSARWQPSSNGSG